MLNFPFMVLSCLIYKNVSMIFSTCLQNNNRASYQTNMLQWFKPKFCMVISGVEQPNEILGNKNQHPFYAI